MTFLKIWKISMLVIERTSQFKRDVKRVIKRGKAISKLRFIVDKLANKHILEARYYDHALLGKYINARECHIEPDWLLIYRLTEKKLHLERTGSHSDLF